MYMCLSLLHQGQNAEEEEKKKGRERRGTDREIREIKRGLEKGFGGRREKGEEQRSEEEKKHMDLFKNTAIPESGPFREYKSYKSIERNKRLKFGC